MQPCRSATRVGDGPQEATASAAAPAAAQATSLRAMTLTRPLHRSRPESSRAGNRTSAGGVWAPFDEAQPNAPFSSPACVWPPGLAVDGGRRAGRDRQSSTVGAPVGPGHPSAAVRAAPFIDGGETIPAPAVGSVPVVILRLPSGKHVLRFIGAPLDRHMHSVVWIRVPAAIASQRCRCAPADMCIRT
jgi:hypothetical protein